MTPDNEHREFMLGFYRRMGNTAEKAEYRVRCDERFVQHKPLFDELISVPKRMRELEETVRKLLPIGMVMRYRDSAAKIMAYYADAPWMIQIEIDGNLYNAATHHLLWEGEAQ